MIYVSLKKNPTCIEGIKRLFFQHHDLSVLTGSQDLNENSFLSFLTATPWLLFISNMETGGCASCGPSSGISCASTWQPLWFSCVHCLGMPSSKPASYLWTMFLHIAIPNLSATASEWKVLLERLHQWYLCPFLIHKHNILEMTMDLLWTFLPLKKK